MSFEDDGSLWRFSLTIYAALDVSSECIALQDNSDVDVNVLLFAAWLGATRGLELTLEHFEEIEAVSAEWRHHVLTPARKIRRYVKTHFDVDDTLYEQIKGVELGLEKVAQSRLYALSTKLQGRTTRKHDAIRSNVALCIRRKGAKDMPEALVAATIAQI